MEGWGVGGGGIKERGGNSLSQYTVRVIRQFGCLESTTAVERILFRLSDGSFLVVTMYK